jgi:hypothetical protein
MSEDWSPCPNSVHQEETPLFGYEDWHPNQCLDLEQNVHSVAFNHPHDVEHVSQANASHGIVSPPLLSLPLLVQKRLKLTQHITLMC